MYNTLTIPTLKGGIRSQVTEQLEELERKRAEITKLKHALESNRVRLTEAVVEWKVSKEFSSPLSPIGEVKKEPSGTGMIAMHYFYFDLT